MVQKDNIKQKVIVICGATATGKTDLAINLAKKLNTEVISADSMYIYKKLNVGTAKPTASEMQGIKHHMIDIVSPDSDFSVSDYKNLAEPILQKLLNKGKIPIICGGTGFYVKSLLYNFSYGNAGANTEIRKKYEEYLQKNGNDALFELLKKVDPKTAEKLHKNDEKRVIRALEIFEVSGKPKSEQNDLEIKKYDFDAYCIDHPRNILYDRINKRVDVMIRNGLIEEVSTLIESGLSTTAQSMQAIGYKEVISYLNGETDLEETIELIKLNSRHYAKRQITFFKKLENVSYLLPNSIEIMTQRILDKL